LKSLKLDLNDNAPIFDSETFTFYGWSDNPVIGKVSATDLDSDGNQLISYFIVTANDKISIEPSSGQLFLLNLNETFEISVGILAIDDGTPSKSEMTEAVIIIKHREDFQRFDFVASYAIPGRGTDTLAC
jgi:hypothetical protein